MREWFWVDGVEERQVPADDRGLNLADGAFETLRVERGSLMRPNLHRNRLARGLKVLRFSQPAPLAAQAIRDAAERAKEVLAGRDGSVRITVTRGSGPRGYAPPSASSPRIIFRVAEGLPASSKPMTLTVSQYVWPHHPQTAGCKLLARIEQVLALGEARQLGFEDAIMLNSAGNWQSTCTGNLFLRMGDTLFTPPVDQAGIAGTRRKAIIDHWASKLGLEVHEEGLSQRLIGMADEAFSCNSIMGVQSISRVDDLRFESFRAAEALRPLVHRSP